jgi:hypothetical protein
MKDTGSDWTAVETNSETEVSSARPKRKLQLFRELMEFVQALLGELAHD